MNSLTFKFTNTEAISELRSIHSEGKPEKRKRNKVYNISKIFRLYTNYCIKNKYNSLRN